MKTLFVAWQQQNKRGWHPVGRLFDGSLDFWEGDRHFLPLLFDDDPHQFHGVMPYEDGRPTGWSYAR